MKIMMTGKNVVVTGGGGFIGSHLVEKLLAAGARVTVIDNFLQLSKIEHLREHSNITIYRGDVRDAKVVSNALEGQDIVIHLASIVGVEESQRRPIDVLDVEIQGTQNLLTWATNHKIKRIVYASSSEVYGDSPTPMDELGPVYPKSTYAIAKLACEQFYKAFHQRHGIEYTCLRYFNVYGPRQDDRFVIPRFVKGALSGESIMIHGNGDQTRDFTYIDDVTSMTLIAGIKAEVSCTTINIGTGSMITINDLARLVVNTLISRGNNRPVNFSYIDYSSERPREIEVFARQAGIVRSSQLLEYEPKVSLPSGIEKYVDWYLEK